MMTGDPPEQDVRDESSLGGLFMQLVGDVEHFVRAEMRLYRAQLFARLGEARTAILLGATAFLLAQSALIAMLVGLVIILRRPLGPIWATVIVVGVALLVSALLVTIAARKIMKITDIKADAG